MTKILHILDHSLPLHSGYTFRTRAILKSQQASGLEIRALTGQRHKLAADFTDGAAPNSIKDDSTKDNSTKDNSTKDTASNASKTSKASKNSALLDAEEYDDILFYRTAGEATGPVGLREWGEISALSQAIETLAQQWRPDIIHAHSPALCGHGALRAARRLGIPLAYEIRAFWEDAAVGNGTGQEGSLKYRMTRALENRVVAGADSVFTICNGLRDDLITRGFDGERISISPNGVDLTLFGEPPARNDALAQKIGLDSGSENGSESGPVIGFIGSFYDYEGLDDLIEAMPYLREKVPHAQLLLVGGGPRDEALRNQAAASKVKSSIHFTGRVPHHEVEQYYSLIDILAYPRKASRLTELVTPLKPLEAMAQGRIVAASDVGGHRELIHDGVTGALFPADDPRAMGAALAALLDRKDEWDALRARAKIHVRDHHDWARNVQRYHSVYHNLLAMQADGTQAA